MVFCPQLQTIGLASAKNYFLENSFNLKPLSLLHVEGYAVSNWKGLGAKNLWEERTTGMFSVVSRRTFLVQVLFHSPCSNFLLSFSSFILASILIRSSQKWYLGWRPPHFLQMSKGLRLGCQNVPSKKTDLATLLVAIVGSLNPKLYKMDVFPAPSPFLLSLSQTVKIKWQCQQRDCCCLMNFNWVTDWSLTPCNDRLITPSAEALVGGIIIFWALVLFFFF